MHTTVSHIIDAFGGIRPMGRLLNYPHSTVQRWELSGSIRRQHHSHILKCAKANNVALRAEQLAALVPKPKPRKHRVRQ